ncbi:MAG: YtxH domain-containing protein [Polyangiales bacterium]
MNPVTRLMGRLSPMGSLDRDQVMRRLGVETRRSLGQRWMPPTGGFGVGFGVGVAVGLLVAPKAGEELRGEIRESVASWFAKKSDTTESATNESSVETTTETSDDAFRPIEPQTVQA